MYNLLKKTIKTFLPQSFLFRYEEKLRWPLGVYYQGDNHQCPICEIKLSTFVKLANGETICPRCGSLPRTRRLWRLLFSDRKISGKILHFSPSRSMYRRLSKIESIEYVSTDYENEFIADRRYDITQIEEPDHAFDLIICYHVLEHIEQDALAIKELFRILKPGGKAFIQTPFKEGKNYENPAVQSPEERKVHFGQEDHVRIYSVAGLQERLEKAGFQVEISRYAGDPYYGLKEGECVLIASK